MLVGPIRSLQAAHSKLPTVCRKMKFEDLDVWKRSARLSVEPYKCLADCRDYGFKDQITRSGLSIPSNIAEGMDRISYKEKIRLLDIAKGSCAELRTQIWIGMEIGYLQKQHATAWVTETQELSAMLVGLIRSLKAANCKLPTDN